MKKLIIVLIFFCSSIHLFAQLKVPVFVSGSDGYKSYRIPAIISLSNGDLLAFC